MDERGYIERFRALQKGAPLLMCECCGVETASVGDMCICSNCENMVVTNRNILEKKDHVLLDTLDKINKSLSEFKYDDAIALYEKLMADRKEPSLMYAAAIAYLKYSNYEIMQIGYQKPGFMEGNTMYRDNASKLTSTAKKLLTKSISTANAEVAKGNNSLNLVYTCFLAAVKMENVKGAQYTVQIIQKMGNEYIYNYSQMVFDAMIDNHDDVIKVADKLTKKDSFSINAFYYIALALFKKGKSKDAKLILEGLNGLIKSQNLEALIFQINEQTTIWK